MNTCRYKSVCKFCSTYLVCIESFDLCCNGIKIPTDIVGEKAGYKDRKMGVSENDSRLRLQERQSQEVRVRDGKEKGHWGMCQLFDLCSEGEEWRRRERRRDMETDRVNLCGTEPGPVTHTWLTEDIHRLMGKYTQTNVAEYRSKSSCWYSDS